MRARHRVADFGELDVGNGLVERELRQVDAEIVPARFRATSGGSSDCISS